MSQFFKKFLAEDGAGLNTTAGRFFALGAFGKHPGWDDHVEDLGLETETLILAKRILYVQGVGGQIDTGAWEKLEPARRTEGFNHVFIWQRGTQLLIGRMWSSSDGKGRTRYPMVVCAHCSGVSLAWGLEKVLPRLDEVEQACKTTNTADGVRAVLGRARNELRAALGHPLASSEYMPSAEALNQFVSAPALGPDRQGWFRIIYHIKRQMAAFGHGSFNPKGDFSRLRSQQIRVPAAATSPDQAVLLWSRFLAFRIDRQVPMLITLARGEPWLDVTLGEPISQDFFCLRALPAALPMATDVPYELDDGFKLHASDLLADFQSGKEPSAVSKPSVGESSGGWASITQRWFKGGKLWLLVGGGVILLASAVTVVFRPLSGNGAKVPQVAPVAVASVEPKPNAMLVAADKPAANQEIEASRQKALAQQNPEPPAAVQENVPVKTKNEVATATAQPIPDPAPTSIPPTPTGRFPGIRRTFTNNLGMVLVWIASLPGTADGAWVGKFEVTQREFGQVMGSNPSESKNPLQPVESVSWLEAVEFCRKLTAAEKAAGTLPEGCVYTLPTQVQWEGFLGDARFDDAVTSRVTPRSTPAPVGSVSLPNQYGLLDVLGNVWEWCADATTPQRILKGGAYNSTRVFEWKTLERTSARHFAPDARSPDAGFRCLLEAE